MAYLKYTVFVIALSVLFVHIFGLASVSKRSEPTSTERETCTGRTPCGWAIYNRTNRYIDYFMKNRCQCGSNKKCLRDDDDISIAAYVYRCKVEEEAEQDSKS